MKNNDQDTLQIKDESNTEWVKQWCKIAKKKSAPKDGLAIGVIPTKKEPQRVSKFKSEKLCRL